MPTIEFNPHGRERIGASIVVPGGQGMRFAPMIRSPSPQPPAGAFFLAVLKISATLPQIPKPTIRLFENQ